MQYTTVHRTPVYTNRCGDRKVIVIEYRHQIVPCVDPDCVIHIIVQDVCSVKGPEFSHETGPSEADVFFREGQFFLSNVTAMALTHRL